MIRKSLAGRPRRKCLTRTLSTDNNTYHCAAEMKVERIGHQKHYIPVIVLFINGIPVVVIECKRNAYTDQNKEPIELAVHQLATDYQATDGIPQQFL